MNDDLPGSIDAAGVGGAPLADTIGGEEVDVQLEDQNGHELAAHASQAPVWQRYARGGFKRVPGWLSPLAAQQFALLLRSQEGMGISGPVCELGAHLGRTFILLHLLARPEESSVAFDLYELQDVAGGRERKRRLREYLKRHGGDNSRVTLVDCDSLRLSAAEVRAACQGSPRVFSIDAGRSAGALENDLALAADSICPGGLVCITDYFQERWPEVSEGTCRFMRQAARLVPVAIGGNKFFFTDGPEAAAAYRATLGQAFGNQARASEIFGAPVLLIRPASLRTRLARTSLWRALRDTSLGARLRNLGVRGR